MNFTSNIPTKPTYSRTITHARFSSAQNGRKYKLAGLLIISLFSFSTILAQQETNYAVHANIIYHFTKYIDWPANKKSGDFVIGVVGETALYEELTKSISGKMAGDQEIVVNKFSSSSGSFNCHILFISEDESSNWKKIVSKTAGSSTLLVSESEGLAQRGGCINFIIISDHLKLEINKNNIEQRGLGIASELLQLGKIVK
ncbi:MAG: YfiR family protein [Chitinophagaceae bacterium]